MELNMKFIIEQIAICPKDSKKAKELLKEIGAVDWSDDEVTAEGKVFGNESKNTADLSFNYELIQVKSLRF